MMPSKSLPILCAGLLAGVFATCSATAAQQTTVDGEDADLAYAQCIRDNGYAEFPDPTPDGFQFLIDPEDVSRFRAAAAACRELAPEGMREEEISPERLDALFTLSLCIRENGVPQFPDPDPEGGYDLQGAGVAPGDARFEAAMAACSDQVDRAGGIAIGG